MFTQFPPPRAIPKKNKNLIQITYNPKSAGKLLNDMSLSPNVVRLWSWENPDGNLKQK